MIKYALFFGVGAAGGAIATVTAWLIVSKALDRQFDSAAGEFVTRGSAELRRTLDTEIPARVGAAIDQKFAEAGITRQTGQQLTTLLDAADRIGLIGLSGRPNAPRTVRWGRPNTPNAARPWFMGRA